MHKNSCEAPNDFTAPEHHGRCVSYTDVLVEDFQTQSGLTFHPTDQTRTHVQIKSLERPFMVETSLVIMKLSRSALLSCNLHGNQCNPPLARSGLTPLTPRTVSNSLSVGLNKAK